METFNQADNDISLNKSGKEKRDDIFPTSVALTALIIAFVWIYTADFKVTAKNKNMQALVVLQNETDGATLVIPLALGNLGSRMIEAGVINQPTFEAIYTERGGLTSEEKELLTGDTNNNIIINQKNAGFILNFLWAFGLSNKNSILENGPMADTRYGSPDHFASTGGWTIASGNIMNHYSAHSFVTLTAEQQELVERVSKNVYRPCCDNSTYFPDCNHGMAMLGLLELLAATNANEQTMYKVALQMNIFWFPKQYATIAEYLQQNGRDIESANPKEILGINYSSASGYRDVLQAIAWRESGDKNYTPRKLGGGGCGI